MMDPVDDPVDDLVDAGADADAADEARIKADARRKRILEKSKDRMRTVSGEQSKTPDDSEAMSASQSSGSSRMSAMRRRRYLKKVDDAKLDEVETNGVVLEETIAAAVIENKEESPLVDEINVNEVVQEPDAKATLETVTEVSKVDSFSNEILDKRKYKGVAAVRRQKALEKQRESESITSSVEIAPKVPIRKKVAVNAVPIMMHMITIIILLAAGFDVGYQQMVYPTATVHRQLAPWQHGIGLLHALGPTSVLKDPKALLMENQVEWSSSGMEDEFDVIDDNLYEVKIDPLFGMDLDLMTKGDGILYILARGAVSCHRVLLSLFYYFPIKIFTALLHIPQTLLTTPPVLALVAIVVRQLAKRVFGATLPIPEKETAKEDVLGMIKNGVMSFLSSSFPTVVGFYDAFTHLTSDMFVMLCGVFLGLAWTHRLEGSQSIFGTDEL